MAKPSKFMLLAFSVSMFVGLGCRSAPITGRKQVLLVEEREEMGLGLASYQQILQEEPLSQNQQFVEIVNRVGQRIATVAERPDYQWEFRVIASGQANAFALPGGKVAVYEGILPICESEAGLAVVMAHEIAHVLARHGGERMSHGYIKDAAGTFFKYATRTLDEQKRQLADQAFGTASRYGVMLPYSRKHESEADKIGLLLMAKAGYDPAEAPRFWQRFAASSSDHQPLEFFSTHPADGRRASDLFELLPEAQQLYYQAMPQWGRGEMLNLPGVAFHPPTVGEDRFSSPPRQPTTSTAFAPQAGILRPTQAGPSSPGAMR
ncbi:MAG: M48 family metallopeptidase [Pirellulaceae bacterium]|nr:M48 family metallopeptidase [Pirellulaceae bacterium]